MLGIRPTDPVAELVDTSVATIRPTASLSEATRALTAEGIGLLVVVDPHGVRGVLSERDVVGALAEDASLDLDEARVRDWATDASALVAVPGDTTVAEAARTMLEANLRHLAVTKGRHVIGVVSMRDLLAAVLEVSATSA